MNDENELDIVVVDPAPEDPPVITEVISVDELLERLTLFIESQKEQEDEEAIIEEPVEEDPAPVEVFLTDALYIDGIPELQTSLEAIQESVDHSFLTTPFEDYTTTEGLLLVFLILLFLCFCAKLLRGAFSWL